MSTAERKHELIKLLKLNLWGNRCDLSLSSGAESNSVGNPVELLDSFESDLLIDDTRIVWNILNNPNVLKAPKIVDIVLDNAGYELFTDLCLASFLIAHDIVDQVRFHAKRIPWFVSDVNLHDFHWLIGSMSNSEDTDLKALGDICKQNLDRKKWTVEVKKEFQKYPELRNPTSSMIFCSIFFRFSLGRFVLDRALRFWSNERKSVRPV